MVARLSSMGRSGVQQLNDGLAKPRHMTWAAHVSYEARVRQASDLWQKVTYELLGDWRVLG
jgi:hypothetical protein